MAAPPLTSGDWTLIWNYGELERLLRGPTGPVARDLARRAAQIESRAKLNASNDPGHSKGPGPAVDSGRLRGSITWQLHEDAQGVYADIGTNVEYARFVEEGTVNMRPYPYLRPALDAGRI